MGEDYLCAKYLIVSNHEYGLRISLGGTPEQIPLILELSHE
jgi:hypothetical protein